MSLLGLALLFPLAGCAYLSLVGAATLVLLLPRRWAPYAVLLAPLAGWATLVALGYPLNAALPFRWVVVLLGVASAAVLLGAILQGGGRSLRALRRPAAWSEAVVPLALGLLAYALPTASHLRAGTLSSLLRDSDAEHFADVIAGIMRFPIGWSAEAQQGLEATPVGLAYHYVHATLSVVTGADAFVTALPSHFLLLGLAVPSVYLFARVALRLPRPYARAAAALYVCAGFPLIVASFGWGQQTAAIAAVPFGLATLAHAVRAGGTRATVLAGLAGALAADSLYLASAPLVGGIAAALAAIEVGRQVAEGRGSVSLERAVSPLVRLAGIGAVAALAGALSHLSAASFLLAKAHEGFLSADDLSGRSTHVSTFSSAWAWLGVTPLDLFRTVSGVPAGSPNAEPTTLLSWTPPLAALALVGGVAGAALMGLGFWRLHSRRPALLGVLAVAAAYEGYLRLLRPFPYGEFKLLSSVWFLAPCLVATGLSALRGRHRAITAGAGALALVYALALVSVQAHADRFLALPWGAAVPNDEYAQVRALTQALPMGASVYVSGQLTPEAAFGQDFVITSHRAGLPSVSAQADYQSRRWRGLVTHALAFARHPVYGLVRRHSTELRAPIDPADADYALLDRSEDPRLFGLLPFDLAQSAGTARLYKVTRRPHTDAQALQPAHAGGELLTLRIDGGAVRSEAGNRLDSTPSALPAPVLPIGESLPGRLNRSVAPPSPRSQPPNRDAAGSSLIGLQALQPSRVEVIVQTEGGPEQRRALLLLPGLTWYTTPPVTWPATIRVRALTLDSAAHVRIAGVTALDGRAQGGGESLERSESGSAWPLLTTTWAPAADGGVMMDAWYSHAGTGSASWAADVHDSQLLWIGGGAMRVPAMIGSHSVRWQTRLQPSAPPQLTVDGQNTTAGGATWRPDSGEDWLWLSIGRTQDASLHEPAAAELRLAGDGVSVMHVPQAATALPLLSLPVSVEHVDDGALVKGSGDDLFYVESGRLRWVSSIDVLAARTIPWRLEVVSDATLWRLPVGLPLG